MTDLQVRDKTLYTIKTDPGAWPEQILGVQQLLWGLRPVTSIYSYMHIYSQILFCLYHVSASPLPVLLQTALWL